MWNSHLKSHLNISAQEGVFIGRERKSRTKRSGGEAVDVQAASLLVLTWMFNVSILELVSASQIPVVGRSVSSEVMAKAISSISRNRNF